MSLETALGELNARLKAGHQRCTVEQRKAALVLRATLVDRLNPTLKRRQRISLNLPAEYSSLPEAERKAVELGHQLRTNSFSWDLWDAPEQQAVLTVADFREAAHRLHASKYAKRPERGRTAWINAWSPALRKLPPSGVITEAVLLRAVRDLPERSACRRLYPTIWSQVARDLGLPTDAILEASRGYGVDRLTERDIPTDAAIEAAFRSIRLFHWKWAWGMCAAYGLRPHECADLVWLPEGDWIEIADATKTGSRRVTPCPSAWITTFALRDLPRPTQNKKNLAQAFIHALNRDGITIKPYNLRHAYALRLLDRGVSADLGARLMGHSVQVHVQRYQRWIEADRIQRAMQGMTL